MNDDHLDDDQIDDLLSGRAALEGHEDITEVLANLRRLRQPEVTAHANLAEFIAATPPPTAPPTLDDTELQVIPPLPAPAPVGPRPRGRLAHLALAASIGLAGIAGAHAAGVLDVPLLPDSTEPAEVVLADAEPADGVGADPEPEAAPAALDDPDAVDTAPAAGGIEISTSDDGEISARIGVGDLSASIVITGDGTDGYAVDIDVDGVSAACEAALEAIETITPGETDDPLLEAAETACAGEFEIYGALVGDPAALSELLEDLELELNLPENLATLEELFGEGGIPFDTLPDLESGEVQQFFDDQIAPLLEELETFFAEFDVSAFFEDFDPESFDLPEGFELPEELQSFLEDFDPEAFFENFGPEALSERFDGEALRDQLDELFGESAGEELDEFFADFDGDELRELFDVEALRDQLDELFGESAGRELDEFFADFDGEKLRDLFEEFGREPLEGFLADERFDALEEFFADLSPEDLQFPDGLQERISEFFDGLEGGDLQLPDGAREEIEGFLDDFDPAEFEEQLEGFFDQLETDSGG